MRDKLVKTRAMPLHLWTPKDQARFDKYCVPGEGGCVLWAGSTNRDGYGMFTWLRKQWLVHRLAYALAEGPIPDGYTIDHLCRVRACVNPPHLEPVTIRVNTLRGDTINADHTSRTHCPKGHELAGGNLRPSQLRRGWRACLTCDRAQTAGRDAALRDARRSLGLTKKDYRAKFGSSGVTARAILHAAALGTAPLEVLADVDLYKTIGRNK